MPFGACLLLGLLVACDPPKDEGKHGDSEFEADVDADADTDADTDADSDANLDDRVVSGVGLCGGSALATDGVFVLSTCVGPASVGAGTTSTDGTYTMLSGPVRRISP